MEAIFKNCVTIRDSYTQQGLSNHITFRPTKSGAMVYCRKIVVGEKIREILFRNKNNTVT
jgi:hypothetical protein